MKPGKIFIKPRLFIMTSLIASLMCLGLILTGCGNDPEQATDYSDESNWLRLPEITKEVDTIYLYPTAYIDESEDAAEIADIDNESMRTAAEAVYLKQGSVFEESTNVFAPFYRQSNLTAVADLRGDALIDFQHQEQRTDVFAALDYYFENYNEGRPFLIAGHSQGSIMTRIVLDEYMEEHPEYYERMVAAYPIGYSITDEFLEENPHLKFAAAADDTGVIVSWNTEGPANKGHDNLVVEKGALSINPLNWKTDETYASAEENKGSLIENDNGELLHVDGLADAQIDKERGVVVCTTADEYVVSNGLFGPASFHNMDYGFYYENIKENVKVRIEAYFKLAE